MKRKEWQELHSVTDDEMAKFDVFIPNGKVISITKIRPEDVLEVRKIKLDKDVE